MSRTQVLDDLLAAGNTSTVIVEVAKAIIRDLEREKVSKTKARATPIPADWKLTPEQAGYAHAMGMTYERVHAEACKFADYCRAHGKTYIDWDAAWRNWVTSPLQRNNNVPRSAGINHNLANITDLRDLRLQRKQRVTDALDQLALFGASPPTV